MHLSPILLFLTPLAAVLDWFAVATRNKPLEFFAKPAVVALLLVWLWNQTGLIWPVGLFACGLFFSLLGDVLLMLPEERFIPGLAAFLAAHLFYIAGFTHSMPPASLPSLVLALLIALSGWQVFVRVRSGLSAAGLERLKLPILAYSTVIGVMLFSALLTLLHDAWSAGAALLASAGALLFFFSDCLLAWNKFVEPLKYGKLAVIVTYHVGQALITLAVASRYGPV